MLCACLKPGCCSGVRVLCLPIILCGLGGEGRWGAGVTLTTHERENTGHSHRQTLIRHLFLCRNELCVSQAFTFSWSPVVLWLWLISSCRVQIWDNEGKNPTKNHKRHLLNIGKNISILLASFHIIKAFTKNGAISHQKWFLAPNHRRTTFGAT